jgi:hypothetical protein
MVYGNRLAGRRSRVGPVLGLCAGMMACASSQPVKAPTPDFNGAWSAKWCDPKYPSDPCGTFALHLIQRGERICGQHFAAMPRLSKLEEGEPGSVLGTAVGNTAVLLIDNARSGEKNIAVVTLAPKGMQWRVIGTAIRGDRPWDSIIGGKWMLSEDTSEGAVAGLRALMESPCRWPDEIPSG